MANGILVYRFSRRLPLFLFALALVFAAAPFLPNDRQVLPLGHLLMAAIPVVVALLAARAWKYSVRVDDTIVEVGAFKRQSYAISKATSIDVRMTKAGRVATISFSDGRNVSFGKDVIGFDDLVSVISQRSSLPVKKPVWDP